MGPHRSRGRVSREAGFTLIELLVAIIVIGVLAAIAVPIFLNQRKKGVDASIKADLRQIAMLQEQYIADHPGEQGTSDVAALGAFHRSHPQNKFLTTFHTGGGYCIIGKNAQGTNGETTNAYWWWDSVKGGLISTTATAAFPAGATACNFAREPWSAVF